MDGVYRELPVRFPPVRSGDRNEADSGRRFTVADPDYLVSPLTGITRRHWADAARFLLEGAFTHVKRFEDPPVFPRTVPVTYPAPRSPAHVLRAEEMEGVARTLLLAAPLLARDPSLTVGGYRLRDYYAEQILRMTDPSDRRFVGFGHVLGGKYGGRTFQQTCESALLALDLTVAGDALWPRFSERERDRIAGTLSSWGHYRTQPHNWRCFNLLILTFFKLHGYRVDETVFRDHLTGVLSYYAGDGWYRDGNHFDYYSTWLFSLVGPVWNSWYGYEHEPAAAACIERNLHTLLGTFPMIAGRDGGLPMWGRSGAYRYAALVPLVAAFFLRQPGIEPGEARAILSKSLLHFITREDVFVRGVLSMGWYRTFAPMVQSYNCPGSVYFTGLAFLSLSFPEDSPFWQSRERDDTWERLGTGTRTVVLDGPGLAITNYGRTGTAEIRPGKVLISVENRSSLEAYSRLSFNTAFPWESGKNGDLQAMNYSLSVGRRKGGSKFLVPNLFAWAGERDGVLYRRLYFEYRDSFRGVSAVDLADIVLPFGTLRVDRARLLSPCSVRLAHYGLPYADGGLTVERKTVDGYRVTIVGSGVLKLALTDLAGWEENGLMLRTGVSPVADMSAVPFVAYRKPAAYSGMPFLVAVMLHRTDRGSWSDEELQPVERIELREVLKLELVLKTGRTYTVDFSFMEGSLSI